MSAHVVSTYCHCSHVLATHGAVIGDSACTMPKCSCIAWRPERNACTCGMEWDAAGPDACPERDANLGMKCPHCPGSAIDQLDETDVWVDAASWSPERSNLNVSNRLPIPGYDEGRWESTRAQDDYVLGRLPWQRATSPTPSACVCCSRNRTPHGPCDGGPCGCCGPDTEEQR